MAEWHPFVQELWNKQDLPPERRLVLLQFPPRSWGLPPVVAVGYLKYMAGEKDSPMFITPGLGGVPGYWCDCLPDGFRLWPYGGD